MESLAGNLLYGLIGTVIGALIGIVGTLITTRFNYHDLFARTVSENRTEWINKFREEISTIVAAVRIDNPKMAVALREVQKDDVVFQAEKARASLLTRLNQDITKPGNEYNRRMREALEAIDFCNPNGCDTDYLLDLSRKILEPEWKRVKEEARGRRHV